MFCSSLPEIDPVYLKAAKELGELIAKRGQSLIYGGSRSGSMGAVADGCLSAGGKVIGVITAQLAELEIGHDRLTELIVEPALPERKSKMMELADAFVVLPGGFGTIEEASMVIQGAQIELHRKPTVIVNMLGFFNPLITMYDRLFERRFARPQQATSYMIADDIQSALSLLDSWDPATLQPKWIRGMNIEPQQ